MRKMPDRHLYEYAIVRYVPRVEREEFVNVGLVMMCKRQKWLHARIQPDFSRISAFGCAHTPEEISSQLDSFRRISEQQPGSGDIAALDEVTERFRWLTAVRSACIQTSRPHPGICSDLDATFDRLFNELVK